MQTYYLNNRMSHYLIGISVSFFVSLYKISRFFFFFTSNDRVSFIHKIFNYSYRKYSQCNCQITQILLSFFDGTSDLVFQNMMTKTSFKQDTEQNQVIKYLPKGLTPPPSKKRILTWKQRFLLFHWNNKQMD